MIIDVRWPAVTPFVIRAARKRRVSAEIGDPLRPWHPPFRCRQPIFRTRTARLGRAQNAGQPRRQHQLAGVRGGRAASSRLRPYRFDGCRIGSRSAARANRASAFRRRTLGHLGGVGLRSMRSVRGNLADPPKLGHHLRPQIHRHRSALRVVLSPCDLVVS
jgi:hypothetical protein